MVGNRATTCLAAALAALTGCGSEAPPPEREAYRAEEAAGGESPDDAPLRVGGTGYDFVAENLRRRWDEAGEGREAVTDVLRATLETSEAQGFPVRLEGGRCHVVLAVGVPSIRNLELALVDEFGTTREEDDTDDAFPSVRLCPRVDSDWTVRLRAFEGYGAVGAQVFGGPP